MNHDYVVSSLLQTGLSRDEIAKLNLLEVGCGAGAVTHHLSKTFATVHSIDTSPSMLTSFAKHLPSSLKNVTHAGHAIGPTSAEDFSSGKTMPSPTPDDPHRWVVPPRKEFDVAIANLVIHHVDDVEGFMKGMTGLVKPGGWVVITEFGFPDNDEEGPAKFEKARAKHAAQSHDSHGSHGSHEAKVHESGSVNMPGHFHKPFTPTTVKEFLSKYGLVDVYAELGDRLPVPVADAEDSAPFGLVARGRKPE